jgi:hypothetical protein
VQHLEQWSGPIAVRIHYALYGLALRGRERRSRH